MWHHGLSADLLPCTKPLVSCYCESGQAFNTRPLIADAFFQDAGGPSIPLHLGRKDAPGPESKQPEGNLPGEALPLTCNVSC